MRPTLSKGARKSVKAMILAAGKGERMRPLTLKTPKPLLEAGGRPLIEHQLKRLHEAGIRQVVINHSWLGEQIEAYLGDGHRFGVSLAYSPEPRPLETAGGIRQALPMLTGDRDEWFLVVNGDIWSDFDFSQLEPPGNHCQALLVLVDNPGHNPEGDFHLSGTGKVTPRGSNRKTFAGISLLHRSLFEDLPPGHQRLAPILIRAMEQDRVAGILHTGQWFDIGTPERLADLDRHLQPAELR
jgi:MurNAc alpha-1-phosphate uridylyltransferase